MTIELYQKVHPRVCGEYLLLTGKVAVWKGSPPRMRGILATIPKICVLARFTPAYAGNMYMNNLTLNAVVGSPPRMRGIFCDKWAIAHTIRFTPAYAGNM